MSLSNGRYSYAAIALASCCLVGAGFSGLAEGVWRPLAIELGTFGLASWLILSLAARQQRDLACAPDDEIHRCNKRLERALADVIRGDAAEMAVDRLVEELIDTSSDLFDRRSDERRPTQRRSITLNTCDTSKNWPAAPGRLKDINPWGIGFEHEGELPLGPAIMTFIVNGKELSLEVNIRWTRQISHRWFSSGSNFVAMEQARDTIEQIRDQHLIATIEERAEMEAELQAASR